MEPFPYYMRSNISSPESKVNIRIEEVGIASDCLSAI